MCLPLGQLDLKECQVAPGDKPFSGGELFARADFGNTVGEANSKALRVQLASQVTHVSTSYCLQD